MKARLTQLAIITLLSALSAPAGSLSVVFETPLPAGFPGDVLTFQGALGTTVSDLGYDAYLVSASLTLNGFGDTDTDVLPFLLNAPLQLLDGESTGVFDFFTVTIPAGFSPGSYDGEFVVLGGPDPDSNLVLGSSDFQVTVQRQGPASPVPEPSPFVLALTGGGLAVVGLRRRRRT